MDGENQSHGHWPRRVALAVLGLGLTVWVGGYGFDLRWIRQPLPLGAAMLASTAASLVAAGLLLWLALREGISVGARKTARGCAGVLAGLPGLSVVLDYLAMSGAAIPVEWRMSSTTGAALAGVGLALFFFLSARLKVRRLIFVQALAMVPVVATLPMLVCLPLGAEHAREFALMTRLAPHTAVAFVGLGLALFFAAPQPGTPAGFLLSGTLAAKVTSRLLLAGFILPTLAGTVELRMLPTDLALPMHLGFTTFLRVFAFETLAVVIGWLLHRSENRSELAERERSAALRQVERQAAILQTEVARRTSELSRALLFNQRLALVASRTTNAVIIGNIEGRIEWVNEGFTRITGYGFEDVVGRTPGSVLQGAGTDPATVAHMRESLAAGRGFEAEVLNYAKDGHEYWVAIEVQPMRDLAGKLIGFTGIGSDITARRLAEDRMRAAKEEAEQLNTQLEQAIARAQQSAIEANLASQAKSAFLATMSHEIRTPLNGIIGMASLLRDTGLDDRQMEFVRTIDTSGDALLTIINDILDYSKIEAGRIELERSPFDLRQCVEDALDLFATKAAEKRLELVCRIGLGVPNAVIGDATRLRQILVNLVGNALKFTAEGQVVVALEAETKDGRLELGFSVTDSGIGIPADRVDRLFQPFSQIDSSTTRKYGGSGLGLAISRRLAEAMGGRMWVESEAGRGSVFHFVIQTEEERLPERPAWQTSPTALAGRRVLVVAENAAVRDSLVVQLGLWGATCGEAADVAALRRQLAGQGGWHVAFVDRRFGVRDGWKDPAEVRTIPGAETLPLILLEFPSGAALAKDFLARVNKPLKPAALFETMKRVSVLLPGAGSDVIRPAAAASAEAPAQGYAEVRILLVEDNPVNQRVATMLLAKLGCQPRLAANGAEAVEIFETEAVDVVFMDMEMPVMDGCEATRRIRASQKGPQPWIVALTANAMNADRLRALAAGMNDFVSKPIRLGDVSAALDRAKAGLASGPLVIDAADAR